MTVEESPLQKTPLQSQTIKTEIVFPNDSNPLGMLNGGRLVQWMDTACAITAQLHTGQICVTVGISESHFRAPAHLGDIVQIRARATRAFNRSLEIRADAVARRTTADTEFHLCTTYLTFVLPEQVPPSYRIPEVTPTNDEERREYEHALIRRKQREHRSGG